MNTSGRNWTRVLALALVLFTVVSLAGSAAALASGPDLYRYSGGTGTYTVGDTINVVYHYSPRYKYEYTYCELYDAKKEKLATTSHYWTNTSTAYKDWIVKMDTAKMGIAPGTYYLKSYVYYKNSSGQYITDSVEWSTFKLQNGTTVELNRSKYTYTVSYLKTKVPKKTITLKAEVEGSDTAVVWSSSDETVATVSEKGKVTMKGIGECTITATAGWASDSCKITVKKQTGTAYYKKNLKDYFDELLDCFDEPFEDELEMREDCDEALEEALELKKAINKVKVLKKDALVKKYINVTLTNIRKADDLAWVDGTPVTDPQMVQYRKQILKYTKALNKRIKALLKQ